MSTESISKGNCCFQISKKQIALRAALIAGIAITIIGILVLSSQFSNVPTGSPGVMSKISTLWGRISTGLSANPLHFSILVLVSGVVITGISIVALSIERCRKNAVGDYKAPEIIPTPEVPLLEETPGKERPVQSNDMDVLDEII